MADPLKVPIEDVKAYSESESSIISIIKRKAQHVKPWPIIAW